MTYDDNERDDLNFFFDDDSSAEEELVKVAEKLETLHREEEEEEMTKKVILPGEVDVPKSFSSEAINRRKLSESISFEYAPDSFLSVPASVGEAAAKHIAATSPKNSDVPFETRKEKTSKENGDRKNSSFFNEDEKEERRDQQQLQARQRKENGDLVAGTLSRRKVSLFEDDFKKVNAKKLVERQDCDSNSFRHLEKERRPLSQSEKPQTTVAVKASIDDNEGRRHISKDTKSLDFDQEIRNSKESSHEYNAASEKKIDLEEHLVDNEEQEEVIVDLTNMETTSSSSSYLGSSGSSGAHSGITNGSDQCTSLSSSSSLLSNDTTEAAGTNDKLPPTRNMTVDMRTNIHRTDTFPLLKSRLNFSTVTTTNASITSAAAHGAESEIRTNQLRMNRSSNGTPNRDIRSNTDDSTTRVLPPGELQRPKRVVRNPYRRENHGVTDSTQAEPSFADDLESHNFPKSKNPKKAPEFCGNDKGENKKTQPLRSESSDEIAVAATMRRAEMKSEELVTVDGQGFGEEPAPEISRSLFAPPVSQGARPSPNLHRFDRHSHPLHTRQSIPVGSLDRLLTSVIVNSLWTQKFDHFNHFQSVMVDTLSRSDNNIVVSAPTGAGKSTIFELAMARFFSVDLKAQGQQVETSISASSSRVSSARKIVYIAPSKALCQERYEDWSRKLEQMNFGLEVALITGQDVGSEQATTSFPDLIAAHLIVTTPEKWDSMTRRWNESFFLFASVKLLLLDEVHLLGDETRGWCLESVVTRMKTIQRAALALTTSPFDISTSSYTETNPDALRSCFRTVAVSATLPNISEVAEFLEANEAYSFDDSYRPVPLTKHVNSLGRVGNNEWRFWSNLSEHVPEIITRFSHGKQCLIFCHSKKETQKVAELLIRRNFGKRGVRKVDLSWNEPVEYMLGHGVGYHHAGMSKDERKTIEEAFLCKKIKCLAATSTLAVGVNLPAHLVIIVGTKAWRNTENGKGYQEIEVSSLLQMIGRAGRPGLDSTGVAVVLTDNSSKKRIEDLLETGIGPVKSNLVPRLPEVLNSEISQRVITSTDDILRWMQTTFLFCCLKHNNNAVSFAQKMGNEAMARLSDVGVVETSEPHSIRPLAGSFIMNRHLVSFKQMKYIADFPFDASQCQILRTMSKLDNLKSFVKRNEKKELKEFHKTDLMKYKLPGAISKFIVRDPSEKAFILLQSYISRHRFKNGMLNDEQIIVCDEAIKFLEVAQEYCVKSSKHGKVAFECYKLQRSLNYALWGESSDVFNQFEWIGSSKTISNALKFNRIRSFQDVLDVSEQNLDKIFAKSRIPDLPKNAGRIVKHTAHELCRRELLLSADIEYTKNSNKPTDLVCSLKFRDPTTTLAKEKTEQDLKFSLIAFTNNSKDSYLIFEENISSPSLFRVPLPPHTFKKIFVHLVGTWVGFDQKRIIDGTDTLVSSNKTSARMLQNSTALDLATDPPTSIGMKKRRRPTGSSYASNLRQNEKRHCTEDIDGKKPSPVTPQPNSPHKQGISFSNVATNQQLLGEIWKESLETFQSCQSATMSHTPNYSDSLNRPQADSMTVTPTRRIPSKMISPHKRMPSSVYSRETNRQNLPSKFSGKTFVVPIVKKGHPEISRMDKWYGYIDEDQFTMATSKVNAFTRLESSVAATKAKGGEIPKQTSWDEPSRQSDQWPEDRTIAIRAKKKKSSVCRVPTFDTRKSREDRVEQIPNKATESSEESIHREEDESIQNFLTRS